jgi:hypothetical protein
MMDMLGRYVEIGDLVAFPDRRGANMWMNVGRVSRFEGPRVIVELVPGFGTGDRWTSTAINERLVLVKE